MARNRKIYKAMEISELSLQFYRDKFGTPNFLVTSNPQQEGKDFCTGVDKLHFARCLANEPTLSVNELVFLCEFFDAVRRELANKVVKL